ncbi:MAG: heparinase II/III-family protein, partial [Rhodocyclaceae bacterium]|nr:heparinase II/III-family protein [Rhodocyclaceae bacterium]
IMDAGGNLPMFGDDDDGAVVNLTAGGNGCRYRSLLATGALLFGRGDFKAKAGALDDKTAWLLGAGAAQAYRALPTAGAVLPVRRAFPDGGYYILGSDFETSAEIRLVADAGPLGYRSIAAHGHADALSFTLSVGGIPFLIDPGTYAYHTEGEWRAYFRSTAAHNTLRVDGCDQSEQGGNFMWLAKADTACRLWRASAALDLFEGWHDGYMRLADPVMHSRHIALDKLHRRIVIEDDLHMTGEHDVELFFHCGADCRVAADGDGYRLSRGGRSIRLALPAAAAGAVRVHVGSLEPIAGWVSPRFDVRQPAPTLHWHARLSGATVLRSEIAC